MQTPAARTFVVIGPSAREYRELHRLEDRLGVRIETFGKLARDNETADPNALIESAVKAYRSRDIAGVIGSDDLGSFVASVIAKRLGLPGPSPESVFNTQHKFLSRESQRTTLPAENVPDFRLVALDADADVMPLPTPFFLKPVKSHLSVLACRIDSESAFGRALSDARAELRKITKAYEDIRTAHLGAAAISCDNMIAESLIKGDQVTVEGFISNGEVKVIGVVDSVMYPSTQSFKQFDYPSQHSASLQQRMNDLAAMVARGAGLDNTMFNVEMSYDAETDELKIIELNSRMSSQFADLFEKVDGTNTYEVQLALASGEAPHFEHGRGEFSCASSFVLRTFEDRRVERIPQALEIEALKDQMPDVRVEILSRTGGRLSDSSQDTQSFRYAIISLGGKSKEDLERRRDVAVDALPFELTPVQGKERP